MSNLDDQPKFPEGSPNLNSDAYVCPQCKERIEPDFTLPYEEDKLCLAWRLKCPTACAASFIVCTLCPRNKTCKDRKAFLGHRRTCLKNNKDEIQQRREQQARVDPTEAKINPPRDDKAAPKQATTASTMEETSDPSKETSGPQPTDSRKRKATEKKSGNTEINTNDNEVAKRQKTSTQGKLIEKQSNLFPSMIILQLNIPLL